MTKNVLISCILNLAPKLTGGAVLPVCRFTPEETICGSQSIKDSAGHSRYELR
jgi:hypothetical protein